MIPFFGIKRQYSNLRKELLDTVDSVWKSGQVLDGYYTTEFEEQIAARCNRKFAVAVNSGTQALIFAQRALGVSGNVLIPGISFIATLNSVTMSGNKPVFVDSNVNDIMMELKDAAIKIENQDISAVMYVNLFGNIINYNELRTLNDIFFNQRKIPIIEDAAQSFGATYNNIPSGKLGDISILSFDPTKNLNNYGSGGMILTDNHVVYATLRDLRDNGKYQGFIDAGTNSKMSESDCASMLVKLKYFDGWQKRRREIAEFYNEYLSGYAYPVKPNEYVDHAWHKYVMIVSSPSLRRDLFQHLKANGVEAKIHYENTLPSYYTEYIHLPVASIYTSTCISLPIYPELTDEEVEYIVNCVIDFFETW